jgi:ATP-dependent DNA ligase
MPPSRVQAKFIEPMLLLGTEKLPEGHGLLYQLKLDGYRAVASRRAARCMSSSRAGCLGIADLQKVHEWAVASKPIMV